MSNNYNLEDMTVSVVIPTHNRCALLGRAIDSVLKQTYPVKEIIVVSDGSEDETDNIMDKYCAQYSNVHYHSYHPGRGGNYARNYGIKISTGKYVAFLDDDDEWHADKIEKQIALIRNDNEIGIVCTAINNIHVSAKTQNRYIPPALYDSKRLILMKNCIGSTSTVLVERELFNRVGYFDEKLSACQDYDMWIRLCQVTKVGVVKEPCVEYFNYDSVKQISGNTQKYILAHKMMDEKYQEEINEFTKSEKAQRKCIWSMAVSKRGMRNGQKKIAIQYALKALSARPCKNSVVCLVASLLPYSICLRFRAKFMKNGLL